MRKGGELGVVKLWRGWDDEMKRGRTVHLKVGFVGCCGRDSNPRDSYNIIIIIHRMIRHF